MKIAATYLLTFLVLTCGHAQAYDLSKLSLEELLAVDLDKSSIPIVASRKSQTGKTINIGLVLPMSKFKDFSKEVINGALLAADEINATGGINGKKLELVLADDAADVVICSDKVKALSEEYNTRFILGPTSSNRLIQTQKMKLDNKLVFISPSATADEVSSSERNHFVFRTSASDKRQATIAANYAKEQLGRSKASILYIDNAYGNGLRQVFSKDFETTGGQILNQVSYSPVIDLSKYDMTSKFGDLISGDPDMIYLITNNIDITQLAPYFAQNDYLQKNNIALFGSDALRGEELITNSQIFDGTYGTSPARITNEEFLAKYQETYGDPVEFIETADAYDIVYLYALAIASAESEDTSIVSQHLLKVSKGGLSVAASNFKKALQMIKKGTDIDFVGVSGPLDFAENGDVLSRDYQIWRVDKKQLIDLETRR